VNQHDNRQVSELPGSCQPGVLGLMSVHSASPALQLLNVSHNRLRPGDIKAISNAMETNSYFSRLVALDISSQTRAVQLTSWGQECNPTQGGQRLQIGGCLTAVDDIARMLRET
jgi:hypothetical protein